MSLLPYHKGNKTKFTNLLFPLIPKFNKTTIPAFYRGKFSKRVIFVVFFIFKDGYREGMGFIRGL